MSNQDTENISLLEKIQNVFKGKERSPDENKKITEIITSKNYPVEIHKIETIDGYILTTYRIPSSRKDIKTDSKKPPVLFQHGILDS